MGGSTYYDYDRTMKEKKNAMNHTTKKKKGNSKPRLNWNDDHENLYDDFSEDSYTETKDISSDEDSTSEVIHLGRTVASTPVGESGGSNSNSTGDLIVPDTSNEEINEVQEIFDDVTIDDLTVNDVQFVELGSDEIIIENTSVLSNKDETSVVLIEKEMERERNIDSSCEDDWDVVTAMLNLKNSDYSFSTNDDEWDALNSVSSVITMETFQSEVKKVTYKDILAKKGSNVAVKGQTPTPRNSKIQNEVNEGETSSSSGMLPIDENDCFDGYSEYEGYKYSRGGKNNLMFRGINRHQRGRTSSTGKRYTCNKNYRKSKSLS